MATSKPKRRATSKKRRGETVPEARLDDEAREFVVTQLAAYDPPSVVAKAVKETFGFDITPQGCEAYDPTKRAGRGVAKKWAELFNKTRKAFIDGKAEIGIAHKTVRLRTLERLVRQTEKSGNIGMTAQLLEQAAKESGDAYSNRHKHEVRAPDGLGVLLGRMKRSALPVTDE